MIIGAREEFIDALDLLEESLARQGLLILTLRRLIRELDQIDLASPAHDAGQIPHPDFNYMTGQKPTGKHS